GVGAGAFMAYGAMTQTTADAATPRVDYSLLDDSAMQRPPTWTPSATAEQSFTPSFVCWSAQPWNAKEIDQLNDGLDAFFASERSRDLNDETNVTGVLARHLLAHRGQPEWPTLPCRTQQRLRDEAKKLFTFEAGQSMTVDWLMEHGRRGEVVAWPTRIHVML